MKKKDLKRGVLLSSKFLETDAVIISFALNITTTVNEINSLTEMFINQLTDLLNGVSVYFLMTFIELDGTVEDIFLNFKIVLTGKKFGFSKHQIRNIIIQIIGDEVWVDLKIGSFSREEILVEIIPIHFGITDKDLINKVPKEIFDLIINDPINVISDEYTWINKQIMEGVFAGKHV
jgi:hypothetical protein